MRFTVGPERVWRTRNRMHVIDTRSAGEFARGHVPGARSVPSEQLREYAAVLRQQPLDVAVIAADGPSTRDAAALLQDLVEVAVWEVRGGIEAWRVADLPLD